MKANSKVKGRKPLTQDLLREYLEYREDGHLWWVKNRVKGPKTVGKRFGCINYGYVKGKIFQRGYTEHTLIWLYHYGVWPKDQIDHINGNRSDNRLENLREATNQQNQFNTGGRRNSTSTYKGVSWHRETQKWQAKISIDRKQYYLGIFNTEQEAVKAYNNSAKFYHKEYMKGNT